MNSGEIILAPLHNFHKHLHTESMKKIILTTVLSLCAAFAFAGCNNGGGTDMNKTRHNEEPVQQQQDTRETPENPECPDGDCKDGSSVDECPDGDCKGGDCPEKQCPDGKRPARRDGEPSRVPPVFERVHHRRPRPLPCPAKDN